MLCRFDSRVFNIRTRFTEPVPDRLLKPGRNGSHVIFNFDSLGTTLVQNVFAADIQFTCQFKYSRFRQ